ncbi:hypothetical protein PPTG_22152 [Phytophthora nicotianae INRA-310]|uniref:Uncharacterized protein n=1 Tax=Phytophthora nicotianae (strain INRA-310) TaxID=761204 RepID=W2QN56_PHYN3|nr:hypothetical protein PPTG_22152 [Phytophthora nicotianae INRA-310]ETN14563.1 hypothetical protein PPTG_22152 [Phytophthora nicotianae INRA-310]
MLLLLARNNAKKVQKPIIARGFSCCARLDPLQQPQNLYPFINRHCIIEEVSGNPAGAAQTSLNKTTRQLVLLSPFAIQL